AAVIELCVTRGKEKFLVEAGVIRNVHLAVHTSQAAVPLENNGRVVVQAGGAFFKQAADQHDAEFLGQCTEPLCRRAGNALGQIETPGVFGLAEIQAAMQLLQQHQFGSLAGGIAYQCHGVFQVGLQIVTVGLLNHGNAHGQSPVSSQRTPSGNCMVTQCRLPCWAIRGRQSMPMMSRSGKASANWSSAEASVSQSYTGTRTAPLIIRKWA